MKFNIKLENFEGPFDLLLHLIKKNKMDICDVQIYEITNQYLEIIQDMKEMDLELTSEFILIAATLIEIKSSMLLPKVKKEEEEVEEELSKVLIERLVQYKKFKNVSEYLKSRISCIGEVYTKKPEIIVPQKKDISLMELLEGVTMLSLYRLYEELMQIYKNKQNLNVLEKKISVDLYKVEDKMSLLRNLSSNKVVVRFKEVINSYTDKMEIVVTFLAMLELAKLKELKISQDENFNEIYIEGIS